MNNLVDINKGKTKDQNATLSLTKTNKRFGKKKIFKVAKIIPGGGVSMGKSLTPFEAAKRVIKKKNNNVWTHLGVTAKNFAKAISGGFEGPEKHGGSGYLSHYHLMKHYGGHIFYAK